MNEAVLAELRAIRAEIHELTERVGLSATREDLKDYVPLPVYQAHLASHQRGLENWRVWLPWVVTTLVLLWSLVHGEVVRL